jgi:hypothetical protein
MRAPIVLFVLLACAAAHAQAPLPAGGAQPVVRDNQAAGRTSQRIERVRIEDAGARVDELRYGGWASWWSCAALRAASRTPTTSLTSDQGEFVLTLFERLTAEQLPFYLYLMKHLAHGGVPVPDPRVRQKRRHPAHRVQGKPAAVVNKLRGKSQLAPRACHCAAVGTMLARMHLAGRDFDRQPAQPARPALVERDGAGGAAPH